MKDYNINHLTPCMTNYQVAEKCHFCGITLTPKNHSKKEHVDVDYDAVKPICDDCSNEVMHRVAKAWCLENLRSIDRS